MAAMLQTGAFGIAANGVPAKKNVCSCSGAAGCSIQSAAPASKSSSRLHALDRSKLRHKFLRNNGTSMPVRIRAEQSTGGGGVSEKVMEIASDEAVEGPESQDRNAKVKADELRDSAGDQTPAESTELPLPAELLLQTLKTEDESAEEAVEEQDTALEVASGSAVEDSETFFHDVEEEAQKVASKLDRSLTDEIVKLEEKAEDLEGRQELEAKVVKEKEFREAKSGTPIGDGGKLPATRSEAQEKLKETAKDGYEVLKWAAEGVVSAGKNARQGLGVAKEALDKRVKSFNIAADETKEVSSQVAEAAQKKLGEIHTSTSQFGEELQVNLEDKKAADSLKPEHERNPVTKLGREAQEKLSQAMSEDSPLGQLSQGIQQNYNKVTSEDGPLAQLNEAVSQNLSKASQAGRDFSTRVSERAAEISSKASETADEAKENTKDSLPNITSIVDSGGEADQLKGAYEDERGNELLKGQISSNEEKTTFTVDADQPQSVPSKKEDDLGIGHDE